MRRPELVTQFAELLWLYFKVIQYFLQVTFWILTVESPDYRVPLFAGQVFIPDLLRGVIRCPTKSELDMRGVVVKIIDLVVNAVVLAVGAFGPKRPGLKSGVLHGIIVRFLRRPFEVVAKIMNLDSGFLKFLVVRWEISCQVIQRKRMLLY